MKEKLGELRAKAEGWVRSYVIGLNGEGADNQYDFYRCTVCGKLVTWNLIRKGERCCSGRVVPTNPKWYEYPRLFLFRS